MLLLVSNQSCLTLCDPMDCSTPGPPSLTISRSLPKFMSIARCHPAISPSDAVFPFCPQSFTASGAFPMSWLFTLEEQNTGASTSASVLPMSIQILISFKTDWFEPLAVPGTLRSFLQQHSWKASILWHSKYCYYLDNNGLIPGLGRFPEGGYGNPLQYSCLENPRDRETWQATVQRIAKSWTRLK